jgi:hypothetical protein
MKNVLRLIGIIAIIAVTSFSFASCKEDGGNPFVGTWAGTISGVSARLEVTETTWNQYVSGLNVYSGDYTYSGNTANFTVRSAVMNNDPTIGTSYPASVSGDTLTFQSRNYAKQ